MQKIRSAMIMMVLAAVAMIISSCGNGGTPVTTYSTTTLSGSVTDKDVSGATVKIVSMKTGQVLGTGTTGTDGSYTVNATLGNLDSDDVVVAIAEGGSVDSTDVSGFLKFKSIIGSKSDLDTAGADGAVDASEIPDLTVSNVTTAKVALVETVRSITIDEGQTLTTGLDEVINTEKEQEKENLGLVINLAASIKAIVDNPTNTTYSGELGTKDIATYVKDNLQFANGVVEKKSTFSNTLATAGADLEDDILALPELMNSAVGEVVTTTYSGTDLAGTWYGYNVDTWGDDQYRQGVETMTLTIAATGGSCTSSQIYITMTPENGTASNHCATLSNNVVNFSFTETGSSEKIEVTGNVTDKIINGTFTVKNATSGAVYSGGIWKVGKQVSTDNYNGTYTFSGEYTVLHQASTTTGSDHTAGTAYKISGSFTVLDGRISTGSITEEGDSGAMTMAGTLNGPRVKARLNHSETTQTTDSYTDTVFIIFMINESTVTGLYGSFLGTLTEPTGDPQETGKFKFVNVTKS